MTGVFERLGVRPIINVSGGSTRLGGALMRSEVVEAMAEAAVESVAMVELQAAASRFLAEATGAEAGYVTAGASAGLTLATAACLAGSDLRRIDRLPETDDLVANEVVIAREHRNGYDRAFRLAGAKLVDVGMNEVWAGAGVRATEAWEFEAAITERTVAIAYFARPGSNPPLVDVIRVAKQNDVPVIVDAAAQLPPVENLRHFTEAGADLVSFSGGKALRAPQASGFLVGRRDLIQSVALQHLDLDEHFGIWEPPPALIAKEELHGLPRHGIGRGFKVSKEAIVGLLIALELFTHERWVEDAARLGGYLDRIAAAVLELPRVRAERPSLDGVDRIPLLHLTLEDTFQDAFEVSQRLKEGNPPVYVNEGLLRDGKLIINPLNLDEQCTEAVIGRLREVLGSVA